MLTGTNLTYTKDYNHRIVFETIRLNGPISRAEIARETTLTAQTVSNIAKRLIDADIICEGEKRQQGRGAPSVTLEINPDGAYSIGLDFNRDHLTGIIVDLAGEVKEKIYYDVEAPTPEESIEMMAKTGFDLMDTIGIGEEQLGGIGVSFPGPMEINRDDLVTTNMVNPKAFPNWKHVPVVKMLSEHFEVPIFLGNNASAAAVGERWYGAAREISSFLYVFFGAGLGAGLMINGQLFEGHNGNAGEIGYLPFPGQPSQLSEASQAHIGEHFNLNSLYKWLNQNGVKVSRPTDLLPLLNNKNPRFIEWLNESVEILAPAFLATEYFIDPKVIFLGGRLPVEIMQYFCDKLADKLPDMRIEDKVSGPSLQCATAGADAAALGAATLPMFDLFAPQHQILIKRDKKNKANAANT